MKLNVLLVEDEELIGEMVKLNLEEEGYEVQWLMRGDLVLDLVGKTAFDLIVLDVMLPGQDGLKVASSLRASEVGTPILMLTARAETISKVQGFDAGADDYLTKPFEMEEFLARVRALIRRSQTVVELPSSKIVRVLGCKVNLETREASSREGRVVLSQKEADLLELFLKNPGKTLSRIEILEEVWGMDAMPTERTVDNFVLKLRKLFEVVPERPECFLTRHSKGYCYEPKKEGL